MDISGQTGRRLKPALVAEIEFLESTSSQLRHTQFIALRADKAADQVRRE
jgi:ATP-dependent DNA ligase